jgi:multidrug resistance efflux pump
MVTCLIILYTAFVVVLFRFKLIRPRPVPIAGVVLLGIFLIGGIVVWWTQAAPMSSRVVSTQYVVQLVPYVKGQIKKIHAQPNQQIRKGDLLLEINPDPYQYTVNQVEAQLQSAQENVKQAQASLESANANVVKARADVSQAQAALVQAKAGVASGQAALNRSKAQDDLARTQEQIALNLQKTDSGAISVLKVAEAVQNRQAADAAVKQSEASLQQAQAAEKQAEAALAQAQAGLQQAEAADRQALFAVKIAQSNVPAVQAQLDEARFNLTQCRMLAPSDGYVVNWQVQEGTMLVSMPMAAAGTFIDTSDTSIIAAFPQNHLTNVKAGNDVELILDPYPGRLFPAKVEHVIDATGEGQYAPSGQMPSAAKVGSEGLFAVKIRLTGDNLPKVLPLGAGGAVAVYTDGGKPVHIISKVTIRMKKWLLYVVPA